MRIRALVEELHAAAFAPQIPGRNNDTVGTDQLESLPLREEVSLWLQHADDFLSSDSVEEASSDSLEETVVLHALHEDGFAIHLKLAEQAHATEFFGLFYSHLSDITTRLYNVAREPSRKLIAMRQVDLVCAIAGDAILHGRSNEAVELLESVEHLVTSGRTETHRVWMSLMALELALVGRYEQAIDLATEVLAEIRWAMHPSAMSLRLCRAKASMMLAEEREQESGLEDAALRKAAQEDLVTIFTEAAHDMSVPHEACDVCELVAEACFWLLTLHLDAGRFEAVAAACDRAALHLVAAHDAKRLLLFGCLILSRCLRESESTSANFGLVCATTADQAEVLSVDERDALVSR